MESIKFILFASVISTTFTLLFIPLLLNKVFPLFKSRPAGIRDIHEGNIPRLGGIGILLGLIATIILFEWIPLEDRGMEWPSINDNSLRVLYFGCFTAWGLGFLDDIFNLKVIWKITAQLTIGFTTVLSGFRIQVVDLPFFGMNIDIGFLSWPVTILWIVGVINAVNLIDGLDGLAGGIVISSSGILALISFFSGNITTALLLVMVMGATFGFWIFNRHPAVLFMGDSGSYLLGYVISILSIWATENAVGSQTLTPLLVLAVPLIDTLFTLIRRQLLGLPFYSADHDHIHHRLLKKGLSTDQTIWFLISMTLVFGSMGGMMFFIPKLQGFAILGAVILTYMVLYWVEYDAVRRPIYSALNQSEHRKKRILMIALSDKIDDYLSKDTDFDSILRSLWFWMELADVARMELYKKGSMVWDKGPIDDNVYSMLAFCHNEWEVRVELSKDKWTVDSDVKSLLMENVSNALIDRLVQLDSK